MKHGRFWSGLIVATNIAIYLTSIVTWITLSEYQTFNISLLSFNLLFSGLLFYLFKDKLAPIVNSKYYKQLATNTLSFFLLFFILGIGNYLAFKHPVSWDLSARKVNSLTHQSVKVVKGVEGLMEIDVLAKKVNLNAIKNLLELYRLSKSDIKINLYDSDLRPDLLKKYEIKSPVAMVFKYNSRTKIVDRPEELAITNTIIQLTREKDPAIFFTTGHGEKSFEGKTGASIKHLRSLLEKTLYKVRPIELVRYQSIPKDVDLLVIWGPTRSFLESELKSVEDYLKRGGKLLVSLDPSLKSENLSGLRNLLAKWNISVKNNYVLDSINFVSGSSGSVPIVKKLNQNHEITKGITDPIFFPLVSTVSPLKRNDGKGQVYPLAYSTPFPASWAENNMNELFTGKVKYNENEDDKGPLTMALAWEEKEPKKGKGTKLVAFGSSMFVIDKFAQYGGNYTLFINSVSWLLNRHGMISFNLPVIKKKPVFIGSTQMGVIFYFSVLFVPIILLIFSTVLYARGKRA